MATEQGLQEAFETGLAELPIGTLLRFGVDRRYLRLGYWDGRNGVENDNWHAPEHVVFYQLLIPGRVFERTEIVSRKEK